MDFQYCGFMDNFANFCIADIWIFFMDTILNNHILTIYKFNIANILGNHEFSICPGIFFMDIIHGYNIELPYFYNKKF